MDNQNLNTKIETLYAEQVGNEDYSTPWNTMYYEESDLSLKDGAEELKLEFVNSGGGEGDGATCWVVFKLNGHLYRKDGYYSSWDDNDWDGDLYKVREIQVMRTEYEPI